MGFGSSLLNCPGKWEFHGFDLCKTTDGIFQDGDVSSYDIRHSSVFTREYGKESGERPFVENRSLMTPGNSTWIQIYLKNQILKEVANQSPQIKDFKSNTTQNVILYIILSFNMNHLKKNCEVKSSYSSIKLGVFHSTRPNRTHGPGTKTWPR